MKIYILRHGQAEPYQINDAARKLTEKGVADTQKILQKKLIQLRDVQTIWASPLVRAQQTAALVSALLKKDIFTTQHLEPEADLTQLFTWLQTLKEDSILLVSHLPLVGTLTNRLCNLDESRIRFSTSSLVGIECDLPGPAMGEIFFEAHIQM